MAAFLFLLWDLVSFDTQLASGPLMAALHRNMSRSEKVTGRNDNPSLREEKEKKQRENIVTR